MPDARDLTLLTPPGEIADWRMVLLSEAAGMAGVFDALPGTAERLAADLGLDPHALRVQLDALAAFGLVVAPVGPDGEYGRTASTPDATTLPLIRYHARALRRWVSSAGAALRGEAVDGGGVGEPEGFHDALAANARRTAPAVVDAVLARFPDARSVVDLGGLHGEYSLEFVRRGLTATMQDKPAMIEVARRKGRLEPAGVELFEGDFFEAVPEGPFDLAFCSGITHTFDGDHNRTLYRNLRPIAANVAVVTFLRGQSALNALFAVQMLLIGNGGDTHADADYRAWLADAGFTADEGVVDLPDHGSRSILFAT